MEKRTREIIWELIPPVADWTRDDGKVFRVKGVGGQHTKDWARGFNSCRNRIIRALNKWQ